MFETALASTWESQVATGRATRWSFDTTNLLDDTTRIGRSNAISTSALYLIERFTRVDLTRCTMN
jgi:hypothetical protein